MRCVTRRGCRGRPSSMPRLWRPFQHIAFGSTQRASPIGSGEWPAPRALPAKVLCMLVERRVETGQLLREANGRGGKIVAVRPSRRDISRDKGCGSRNIELCKDGAAVGGEAF